MRKSAAILYCLSLKIFVIAHWNWQEKKHADDIQANYLSDSINSSAQSQYYLINLWSIISSLDAAVDLHIITEAVKTAITLSLRREEL